MPNISVRQRLASFISKRSGSPENPSTPLSAIIKWLNAGQQTVSGESMNEHLAMQITTVRTCVTVLAESVASLPCILYERTKKGRIEAFNNPLHWILQNEPNDEMSGFTFWETIVGANALTGNSYAEIMRTNGGQVGELYPLNPLLTEPYRLPTGQLAFRTKQGVKDDPASKNGMNNQWRHIDVANCLHFRLFSMDGVKGLSPVTLAREALGLTRAAEKFGAKFFGNGSKPGGVLTGPEDADETQLADNRAAWEASQGGSNQGRVAVLSGEWKYQQIGLSPEDSQFLATRVFQRAEIAAMFRVPSHMAGDTSKVSNNSYEQMTLSFVSDTLRPILARIEAEVNRKLMPRVGSKANKLYCQFDLSERLRSDHKTVVEGIAVSRQWGLATVDEGRLMLGMNPIGDDTRLTPVNMCNALLIKNQTVIPNGAPGGGTEPSFTKPSAKKDTVPPEEIDEEEAEPAAEAH